MLRDDYATALYKSFHGSTPPDEVLSNFNALLEKKGHEKLKVSVLKSTSELFEQEETQSALVTVACEADATKYKTVIEAALTELGVSTRNPRVHVESSIVGGFSVEHAGKIVDDTYKTCLLRLYRNITK